MPRHLDPKLGMQPAEKKPTACFDPTMYMHTNNNSEKPLYFKQSLLTQFNGRLSQLEALKVTRNPNERNK
jgi:hypothetical protein